MIKKDFTGYTVRVKCNTPENINGKTRELNLCEECSKKLGITEMDFNMPIDFSSFFGEFMEDFATPEFMPLFNEVKALKCKNCGYTFDDIVNTGKLGCEECYDVFEDKLDPIIKKIQGANRHVGRIGKLLNESNSNEGSIKNGNVKEDIQLADEPPKGSKPNSKEMEIENIDFKHAIEKYPPGSEIRKYYDFFVLCDTKTTELMIAEVKIEQLLLFLTNLKSQIRQLLLNFRLAFTDNGRNFNPAKQLLAMEKSRTDCREEALKMQQFVIDSHELDEKTKSLLKSLASNTQLAQTVADSAKNVNRFYAFYDEQQEIRKRIEENKRKYELEKRKQKQEEKARKLREMQEEQKLYEQTEEPELLENED